MPPEGFADPITSDVTGFRLKIIVSELIKRVTRAIEASDVSSTPPVVETTNGVTTTKTSRHPTGPRYAWVLEESWTCKETKCAVT